MNSSNVYSRCSLSTTSKHKDMTTYWASTHCLLPSARASRPSSICSWSSRTLWERPHSASWRCSQTGSARCRRRGFRRCPRAPTWWAGGRVRWWESCCWWSLCEGRWGLPRTISGGTPMLPLGSWWSLGEAVTAVYQFHPYDEVWFELAGVFSFDVGVVDLGGTVICHLSTRHVFHWHAYPSIDVAWRFLNDDALLWTYY